MVDESMTAWARERQSADDRIGAHQQLDDLGAGNGRSLRWNLQKLIGEYARHNGHADLIRERIDGQTGEWVYRTAVLDTVAEPAAYTGHARSSFPT
jgi:hypothetical protein